MEIANIALFGDKKKAEEGDGEDSEFTTACSTFSSSSSLAMSNDNMSPSSSSVSSSLRASKDSVGHLDDGEIMVSAPPTPTTMQSQKRVRFIEDSSLPLSLASAVFPMPVDDASNSMPLYSDNDNEAVMEED